MRKLVALGAGLVALGAAGWTGAWFYGRGALEREVDAYFESLRAEGGEGRYEALEIGGFPFGYEGRIVAPRIVRRVAPPEDAALDADARAAATGRMIYEAPWIDARADLSDPGALHLTFPPEQTLRIEPGSEDAPALEARVLLEDAVAVVEPEGAPRRYRMTAKQASYVMAAQAAPWETPEIRAQATDVALEGAGGFAAFDIAILDKAGTARYSAAATRLDIVGPLAVGEAAPGEMAVTVETGPARADAASDGATLTAEGTVADVAIRIAPPAESPVSMRAASVDYALTAPAQAAPEPQSMRMRHSVEALEVDEAGWRTLDPGGVFARGPARWSIDAEIEGVFHLSPLDPAFGVADHHDEPMEPRRVALRGFALEGLGAAIRGEGAAEMEGGLPQGAFTFRAVGLRGLLEGLARSGMVPPQQVMMAQLMLENLARKGETEDELVFDLGFENGMTTLNGAPVGPAPRR